MPTSPSSISKVNSSAQDSTRDQTELLRSFIESLGTPPITFYSPPATYVPDPAPEFLNTHHIVEIEGAAGWYECAICWCAGQRKRFEWGDTLLSHVRGGQHQRQLLRRTADPLDHRLPPEVSQMSENEYVCKVCRCGVISGFESARAHVRGVKHVKALGRVRPAAPTLGEHS